MFGTIYTSVKSACRKARARMTLISKGRFNAKPAGIESALRRIEAHLDGAAENSNLKIEAALEEATAKLLSRTEAALDRKLNRLSRELSKLEVKNYQQLTAFMELRRVLDSPAIMPPLRGFAVSPDLVFYLQRLLDTYQPKRIIEFGSGFSSVVLSRFASTHGATVTSIDHEPGYAAKTQELVCDWGYESFFELICVELVSNPTLFYDVTKIPARDFDLVFLDGPPQAYGATVRGGLLPQFAGHLAPGCIIVLDDYYRPGEREVVASWVRDGLVELVEENLFIEKHAAVVRLRAHA